MEISACSSHSASRLGYSQPHISEILLADFFWIQLVIKRMYTLVRHFAKKQCPDPHLNDPDINDPDINEPYCI